MRKIVAVCVAASAAVGFVVGTDLRDSARASVPAFKPSLYTANFAADSVSALGGPALARAVGDITVGSGPQVVAVSHDGTTVYTGNSGGGDGTISLFSTATESGVQTFTVASGGDVSDIAVAPDDSVVYATIPGNSEVRVFDATSHTVTKTFTLPTLSSSSPDPEAIDVTPDGATLFVLDVLDDRVEKLDASDGSNAGHAIVSASSFDLKVSKDGSAVVVLGSGAPQFLRTVDLAPIASADTVDLGSPVDIACSGARVYVLNSAYVAPAAAIQGVAPGGFNPVDGEPTIDVYDAATGNYVHSIGLGAGSSVLAVAVSADGATAYFTRTGAGSATKVDLGTGVSGPTGVTGANPVSVAVNEGQATPVVSYFLPRIVSLALKGPGQDSLVASGFYDDGGVIVDYTKPVTVDVGAYSQTFTLVPNAKGTAFKFVSADKTLKFAIAPNLKGSSLGKFTMKVVKSTLSDKIDASQPVAFHFHATGLADAQGEVTLTTNKYRLGGKRGALTLPQFFPAKAIAKLSGPNQDSLSFKGGFATNGVTPATLSTVRFSLGPTYVRVIPGDLFTKTGDVFKFSDAQGASKFAIVLNFLRETVTVKASKIELGDLAGQTVDVVLDPGIGTGAFRNTVRLGTKGKVKAY